jgi:hypothetical protein
MEVSTMRQAIETKFLGPTNFRGSRVKASCQVGSITIGWDDALDPSDNHRAAARALVEKFGWTGEHFPSDWCGGVKADGTGYVFVYCYMYARL